MEQLLITIYDFFNRRRPVFFIVLTTCFALFGYLATQVIFEEDIAKVLPRDENTDKLTAVFQNSKFMDKLVVTVSDTDTTTPAQPDSLVAYATAFTEKLQERLHSYIAKITDRVDDELAMNLYGNISEYLPIYLTNADYKTIDTLITPARIKETLQQNIRTLSSPAGIALKNMISNDPTGISWLGFKKLQQLQYDENFELYDNYVVTRNNKNLLIFITPALPPNNTGKNTLFLKGLDSIITQLHESQQFPSVSASYFGATAVSAGNALQLRKDSLLTQGITVLFIVLFLGIYFRKKRAPLVIMVPVVLGALFSLAAIYFIKGRISVIALGTGSLVLGIAVNYSLHVFNHYCHTNSIYTVLKDLAKPMTVGSFTTIGGFLCLQLVKSDMLKDLGLFAAFSLIGASLSSLIFLPHLIVSKQHNIVKPKNFSFINQLAAYRPEYNKYLIIGIVFITGFLTYWATKVGFESDLNNMNFMPAQLRQSEKKLAAINQFTLQSVYLLTEGRTIHEALRQNEKLAASIEELELKGLVKKHSGVSSLILSDSLQKVKILQWNNYWTPEKKRALLASLKKEGTALKFKASAFDNFRRLLEKEFQPASTIAQSAMRNSFLNDYITETPEKTTVVTLLKVPPQHKESIYIVFDKWPATTVLDKQYLTRKLVKIINDDFTRIALMTSIMVFLVLLLMYGRIELTLVSFIPMFISWLWILGIMGLLGIQFNIINIIVSALIFGLGDDYSLYIMDGLLQEYKTGEKNLSSFKSSILLSAITTLAGLGVLIFAKHPALQSIAIISIVGIFCVVIMSQILIPFFFNLLIKKRVQQGLFPWTANSFIKSFFSFSIFISLSVFFAMLGRTFVHFRVREKGKLLYHNFLSKACWFLMYIMGNVKKKIFNPLQENFTKPAVIICNHQSSLDIVPLIMLHPKILMFTNNKKWNAPFFGPVIRMADYFPVEQLEENLDRVAERMRHGYSIIVFPEGTRSIDGTIKRFHKGAFYIAEKLNADILPIVIHGTNYALTKEDTQLKDGQVTLKFLPRISPNNTDYGNGYAERSKHIGQYFRTAFETLRKEIEQPAYFREKLVYNYLYKGPVLEWYMRIKTALEKNYSVFDQLVPREGKILDIGCGYGFMVYMLYFMSNKRTITGIDYDAEKIETANNCFSKTASLNFIHTDVMHFELETYDAIIIADVLHYLPPEEQQQIVEKCIGNLSPGGLLIIRDGDQEAADKHKRTLLTEFFSTKLIKFNKTNKRGLFFLSGSFIRETAARHKMTCKEISDSNITSNTIFVLKSNESNP